MTSVAVTMDGCLLLSGSEDQTACVWHVHSRQCLRVLNHRGILKDDTVFRVEEDRDGLSTSHCYP